MRTSCLAVFFVACGPANVAPKFEGNTAPVEQLRVGFAAAPPISGGTLITLRTTLDVVAADPDTDMLWKMRPGSPWTLAGAELSTGDEPGRLVEDGDRRVHVVLRRAGAVATFDVAAQPTLLFRRAACREPSGIAYDDSKDVVYVACTDGQLVTLPAAGGEAIARLQLDDDLRDVVVVPSGLLVSRFHSGELLRIDLNGRLFERRRQPDEAKSASGTTVVDTFTAGVAWRTVSTPLGVMMTYQVGQTSPIAIGAVEPGAPPPPPGSNGSPYGNSAGSVSGVFCSGGVVRSRLFLPTRSGPISIAGALPVDVASNGRRVAVATAGSRVVFELPAQPTLGPNTDCVTFERTVVPGQPVAVTWSGDTLVVQSRAPSGLSVFGSIALFPVQPPRDVGHDLFHAAAQSGLACASCHPAGREDGRVWKFDRDGARRTQTVAGGILGTVPFHWDGTLPNTFVLMNEVGVRRMGHPTPPGEVTFALEKWLETIPRPAARGSADAVAAARGKQLFESVEVGCAACHSGPRFTNNTTTEVGTGARFQVPSLIGVAARAPFMHDGCAPTLEHRFTNGSCGGGDLHGKTSQLAYEQVVDLVAYLKTL